MRLSPGEHFTDKTNRVYWRSLAVSTLDAYE
jgi:hypothetical protein